MSSATGASLMSSRVAPIPLYNRFADVFTFSERLAQGVAGGFPEWEVRLRADIRPNQSTSDRCRARWWRCSEVTLNCGMAVGAIRLCWIDARTHAAPGLERGPLNQPGARSTRNSCTRACRRHGEGPAAVDPDAGARMIHEALRRDSAAASMSSAKTRSSTLSVRGELNKVLIEEAARHQDVTIRFNQTCPAADPTRNVLRFRNEVSGAQYSVELAPAMGNGWSGLRCAQQPRGDEPSERPRRLARSRLQRS